MRNVILLFAFIFSTLTGNTQSKETVYIWPGKVPNEQHEKQNPRQTSNTTGNVIRLTDITNPALVVFEPEIRKNNGAGVIICPGGGYRILAIDKEGYEIAEWLSKLGFTAFVLQYRVPNNRAGALQDLQRAFRVIRSNADKWKLNPHKLGVLGFSAGGHLSAHVSTQFNQETYPRIDVADTLSCKPNFSILIYAAYLDNGENRTLSPELIVNKQTPPMFIFGTADDKYGNSALVMATSLRDSDVPVELHLLARGGHGYGMRPGNQAAETWPVLAETWLKNISVD